MVKRNRPRPKIESPCIQVCRMDLDTLICQGCGRSKDQITNWILYTDEQRATIMSQLENVQNTTQ